MDVNYKTNVVRLQEYTKFLIDIGIPIESAVLPYVKYVKENTGFDMMSAVISYRRSLKK